ncbi:hypothetical protein CF98_05510 [Halopseudomonas bauzanensis]|nr:hypothetical protein CF98_05510 [Halopseudomonas bauzanensis]
MLLQAAFFQIVIDLAALGQACLAVVIIGFRGDIILDAEVVFVQFNIAFRFGHNSTPLLKMPFAHLIAGVSGKRK